MRVAFVLVVVGVAALLSACSSGGERATFGRGAYFDAVEAVLNPCASPTSQPTADITTVVAEGQQETDALATLTPPAELAAAQDELIQSEKAVIDRLRKSGDVNALFDDEGAVESKAFFAAGRKFDDAIATHYGVRMFERNGALLPFQPYAGQALERWQVILFRFPADRIRWYYGPFMDRIVGLPGETVQIRDGTVYIDGKVVEGDNHGDGSGNYNYGPKIVPSESYFVLSDNRGSSYDSHDWGSSCPPAQECDFVPKDHVLGELPPSGTTPLSKWWCK